MHRHPDVFEIPDPRDGKLASWLMTLAMTAIVVGATMAFVAVNSVPHDEFQVTVSR